MKGSQKYFILFVACARVLYSKGPREKKNLKSSENKTLTIFFWLCEFDNEMCFNFLHLLMRLCVRNKLQFDGLFFFLDIDECAAGTHNCSTNTFCTNNEGSYNCTCNPGYYGDVENCEPGKSGLLRATWGVRNPNLKAVITHASHVCSMRSMEWMECTEPNFITRDWTFYHS